MEEKSQEQQAQPTPPKEVKITIIRNLETGQLGVQGPGNGEMYDKYFCLGLLEDAKDFIKTHNAKKARNSIFMPHFKQKKTGGAFGGRRF